MALKMAKTMQSGIELPEAYYKILKFTGGSPAEKVEVHLGMYKDQASRAASKPPVDVTVMQVVVDLSENGNIFQCLYRAIKAKPAFETAENI